MSYMTYMGIKLRVGKVGIVGTGMCGERFQIEQWLVASDRWEIAA